MENSEHWGWDDVGGRLFQRRLTANHRHRGKPCASDY